MIVLPEADWSPGPDTGGSFLTGAAAPLPLGTFRLPSDLHLLAPAIPDDDPVTRADTLRERAGQVFGRQRAIGGFNRDLDDLSATIAESPDWSQGLSKFDQEIGHLRQKHLAELRTPDDRAAFERHSHEFAAMQRIGLKRALVERQHADALAQLDDQLAYYAGKAAAAPNDVFREIAIDAGGRAIAELRDAGYLFPEGAEKRMQAFRGLIDAADLETIVTANPDEAAGLLGNRALFPNADAATRERLKDLHRPRPRPAGANSPPLHTREWRRDRDGSLPGITPRNAPADDAAGGGDLNIDDIAAALAPLVENNDGLRELLDEAKANPEDPGALVRLATNLAEIGPTLPGANVGPVLGWIARLGTALGRILRRPSPDDQPPQLPAPKQRGDEPSAPPTGAPSPISPPRAKPPTVPPPNSEREPEAPQDDSDAKLAPTYSPTKPIGGGADRYKRVGNREFVQYSDGSVDFGEMPTDIVARIREDKGIQLDAAPIRLERGRSRHEGEMHLERGGKAAEIRKVGYESAADLVDDVGNHFVEVWKGRGDSILLVKRANGPKSPMVYVELKKPPTGSYYQVKSGGPWEDDYPAREELDLLWRGERTSTTAAGKQEP
jgi:hypothetical protein